MMTRAMLPELVVPSPPPPAFFVESASLCLDVDALVAAAWKFRKSNLGVEYCSEVCVEDDVREDYFCICWSS